ncbi:hypothetical protein [Desulfovibrio sp.]|uniref:hypothetical protein n=1 Tax=Desulfovibrio sp. TaxID=885 RepID=UPI0025BF0B6D|nr:hypothetical protein [Desulfovibrio sp.]
MNNVGDNVPVFLWLSGFYGLLMGVTEGSKKFFVQTLYREGSVAPPLSGLGYARAAAFASANNFRFSVSGVSPAIVFIF